MMSNIENTFNGKKVFKHPKKNDVDGIFKQREFNTNFYFIIGGQKCGTTSLLANLVKHPSILKPNRKELYFFNNSNVFQYGLNWYLKQFPSVKENNFNIDATANYFESADAPKRLKQLFPNTKIILLLRNPTERAYSHFKMSVDCGFEKLGFSEALEVENERLLFGEKSIKKYKHNYIFQRLAYRTKGLYFNYLQNWLNEFSTSQIKIIQSEKLIQNPQHYYNEITDFLEIDRLQLDGFESLKVNNTSTISEDIKKQLDLFYKSYNEKLFDLIGEKYNW